MDLKSKLTVMCISNYNVMKPNNVKNIRSCYAAVNIFLTKTQQQTRVTN